MWMWKSMFALCMGILLLGMSQIAHAELATGQAAIVNGDTAKAKEDARMEAMRGFVERQVGVSVESTTQVVNNMVLRDEILTHADGYVQVKRVVREWQSGGLYFIELDLEANEKKMQTAPQDLTAKLQAMDENASRSGIQVAVTGTGSYGAAKNQERLNRYLQARLENIGFRVVVNDNVLSYMASHGQQPGAGAEARRIARVTREGENALLRGELDTVALRAAADGYTEAVVHASFELIGLDSSEVNTFSKYFAAVAKTSEEAERRANELAVQEASEVLGQKALLTVQDEYQGGVRHTKITVRFSGIRDLNAQRPQILSGLQAAGCHVIRTSLGQDGAFQVYLSSERYHTTEELREAILQHVPGVQQAPDNTSEFGSTKLEFTF